MTSHARPAPTRPFGGDDARSHLQHLEPRVLLSGAPLPSIDLLEDPLHPVLRLSTDLGAIDIELDPGIAPNTLNNLLFDVRTGLYDSTIFHRLIPGQALHGGAYRHILPQNALEGGGSAAPGPGPVRVSEADPDAPATPWSVSLSEFFVSGPFTTGYTATLRFNLVDDPADPLIGGTLQHRSRVIGRVLEGPSRDVVAAIAALPTLDWSGFLDGFNDLEREVPVDGEVPPGELRPEATVAIIDAELIKPPGIARFYTERAYYPEGFAGRTIAEFVPIVNPNDQPARYQLIARFEDARQDLVVVTGVIAAGSRGGVTLSDYRNPDANLVPQGRPYALELVSTLPLGAVLSHYDFGGATGESFTSEARQTWAFAETLVAEDHFTFLVWQNTTDQPADITVTLYPEDAGAGLVPITVTTQALRRGGLSLGQLGLAPGSYGILVTSGQPIVAALTQYDNRGGARSAGTELGFQEAGSTGAVLPLGRLAEGEGQFITVFNPFDPTVTRLIDPTATVTLRFVPADASLDTVERVLTVGAGRRVRLDAAELRDQLGDGPYSVLLDSDKPVAARASHAARGDTADNSFSRHASDRWLFAEGFMDAARAGTDVLATVSIFNTVDLPAVQNEVTLTFRFADGFTLQHTASLSPGRHLHLDLHTFAPLLEQAAAGRNFFGVEVASQFAVIAQMWHEDLSLGTNVPAGGLGTIGDPAGGLLDLGLKFVPFAGAEA